MSSPELLFPSCFIVPRQQQELELISSALVRHDEYVWNYASTELRELDNHVRRQHVTQQFIDYASTVELADARFSQGLLRCQSVKDVLLLIQEASEAKDISAIRYYSANEDSDGLRLVSVDCIGHSEEIQKSFQIGRLVKYRLTSPLATSDSFWCQEFLMPILFISTIGMVGSFGLRHSGPQAAVLKHGLLLVLSEDSPLCDQVLSNAKATSWVDVPLVVGRTFVGKLSCDIRLCLNDLDSITDKIASLWKLCTLAAPLLTQFYSQSHSSPIAEILMDINGCRTESELLHYTTCIMPQRYFECEYATIFLLSKDSLGSQRLVLRCSSHQTGRLLEDRESYDLYEASLTTWVARNRKTLRLHDLDGGDLEEQLSVYQAFGKNLRRKPNFISDCDSYNSFMAVPLSTEGSCMLGVLRFTQKKAKHGNMCDHFTEQEQQLLEKVTQNAIVPRLLMLRQQEFSKRFSVDTLRSIDLIGCTGEGLVRSEAIADKLGSILQRLLPESEGSRKLFVYNMLCEDGESFKHRALGGSMSTDLEHDVIYPIENSLTEFTLRRRDRRAVFINDVTNAVSRGALHAKCVSAKSALSCAVAFRNRHYGVLIVKSDHLDLNEEIDGRLLEILAASAGALFARSELHELKRLQRSRQWADSLDCHIVDEVRSCIDSAVDWFVSEHATVKNVPSVSLVNPREVAEAALGTSGCSVFDCLVPDDEFSGNRAMLIAVLSNCVALARCWNPKKNLILTGKHDRNWFRFAIANRGDETPFTGAKSNAYRGRLRIAKSLGHVYSSVNGAHGFIDVDHQHASIVASFPRLEKSKG